MKNIRHLTNKSKKNIKKYKNNGQKGGKKSQKKYKNGMGILTKTALGLGIASIGAYGYNNKDKIMNELIKKINNRANNIMLSSFKKYKPILDDKLINEYKLNIEDLQYLDNILSQLLPKEYEELLKNRKKKKIDLIKSLKIPGITIGKISRKFLDVSGFTEGFREKE